MQRHLADEIVACLQDERTVYPYYRDRYGLGLLRHCCRQTPQRRAPLTELRRSAYAGLLDKPRIKHILANCCRALDESLLIANDYDAGQEAFILNLATWGDERHRHWRHQQTSRPGVNLVLQLNFSRQHDRHFQALGDVDRLFNCSGHPVARQRNTLAWARLDVDWASGTALIEEIQSDWVRRAARLESRLTAHLQAGYADDALIRFCGQQVPLRIGLDYCRQVDKRYRPIWAEAMLWAAIAFLREELGVCRIYYHSADSGRLLKWIRWSQPPRSLYTDLPRRFCFQPTHDWPEFLLAEKAVREQLRRQPELGLFRLAEGVG